MDPDALLAEIKQLAMQANAGEEVRWAERQLRWKVAELFGWLAKGGFPPDWSKYSTE